jgi:neutral amino acid transport system substrate-binding protein
MDMPGVTMCAPDNFFRTLPSDALQGKVLATQALAKGHMTVNIIYVTGAYGQGLADAFKSSFTAAGGTVASSMPYVEKAASYTDVVTAALAGAPKGVLLVGDLDDSVKILQEAKVKGAVKGSPVWLFPDGLKDQTGFIDNLNTAKELAQGAIGTAPGTSTAAADQERANKYKAAYKAKFGSDPGLYADNAYDAVYIIAAAIKKAASVDRAAIMAEIVNVSSGAGGGATSFGPGDWAMASMATGALNYEGASGAVDMDANGEPAGFYQLWTVDMTSKLIDTEVVSP